MAERSLEGLNGNPSWGWRDVRVASSAKPNRLESQAQAEKSSPGSVFSRQGRKKKKNPPPQGWDRVRLFVSQPSASLQTADTVVPSMPGPDYCGRIDSCRMPHVVVPTGTHSNDDR